MRRLVLVTGAGGFVGRHLCEALGQWDCALRTLYHHESDNQAERFVMDLQNDVLPKGLLDGVDTIFHLAGKAHSVAESEDEVAEYRQINTEGTRRLLEAAQQTGVQRFIFFSSVKAVGECQQQPMDETCNAPADTPYGQSKYAAEQLVLHGGYVPYPIVIRPSMVYGNTHKGNLPRMIRAVRRGIFPPLPEMNNRRSMVHVQDVVQAALLATQHDKAAGQIYIITDGNAYSTRQIYDWIRKALGKAPLKCQIPLNFLISLAKAGDVIGRMMGKRFPFDSVSLNKLTGSACYSSAKIERELGFQATHNLQSSLPDIVRFLNLN